MLLWRYGCGFFLRPEGDTCWHVEFGKKADPPKKSWTNCILPVVETDHFSPWIICMLHTLNHLTWQVDGSLWSKADPSMLSFLSMLLCKRAGLRYSARRALRDDWLRKIGGSSSLEPKRKGLLEELRPSSHRRGRAEMGPKRKGIFFREFGFFWGKKDEYLYMYNRNRYWK